MAKSELIFYVPPDWSNDDKGAFFEGLVADLLRPMRFKVVERIRVTGMEIDLLAKHLDQPRQILVECKAYKDALPSDTISKLIGNCAIYGAEAGWLFSTSELSKDGRGMWEQIQTKPKLHKKFTWYGPEKIIEILTSQSVIRTAESVCQGLPQKELGAATLLIAPAGKIWVVEMVDDGIPTKFAAFDASTGTPATAEQLALIQQAHPSVRDLACCNTAIERQMPTDLFSTVPAVVRVIPGDSWGDPRPARPEDFVGREDLINDTIKFLGEVREGKTPTRVFAIHGPSGWGKSSAILKIASQLQLSRVSDCVFTAVDSRAASGPSFVYEALRCALIDARNAGYIKRHNRLRIVSQTKPLDSPDIKAALVDLAEAKSLVVLVFDQFEELFAKEPLLDTFNAIRTLCMELDAQQSPIVLGFAWKTDISLPQEHPAYHLWHNLADRRRSIPIRQFGTKDIKQVITKAEKATSQRLSTALKHRLIEQCQGLPWLVKKLLVHVCSRLAQNTSPYDLLERELDVEKLFQDDLATLTESQLQCLRFVASNSPTAVPDVERQYPAAVTNSLLQNHLLVRSGMNYVVYWDIFRDYLVHKRVPQIPWSRTFRRDPSAALKLLKRLSEFRKASLGQLVAATESSSRPCQNLLGDLIALQLVNRENSDMYTIVSDLKNVDGLSVAEFVRPQFQRHVVYRSIQEQIPIGQPFNVNKWDEHFKKFQTGALGYSEWTITLYSGCLRRWLVFAGLLEQSGDKFAVPAGGTARITGLVVRPDDAGVFIGTSSPSRILELLRTLLGNPRSQTYLFQRQLRNAITDASSLNLIRKNSAGCIELTSPKTTFEDVTQLLREALLRQETIRFVGETLGLPEDDAASALTSKFRRQWTDVSRRRNLRGLRRFAMWARNAEILPLYACLEEKTSNISSRKKKR